MRFYDLILMQFDKYKQMNLGWVCVKLILGYLLFVVPYYLVKEVTLP